MIKKIFFFIVIALLVFPSKNAFAQETPHVVHSTIPVDGELRQRVDDWLVASNPTPMIYYAITSAELHGFEDYYISLVALDLDSPEEAWSFTGDEDTGETKVYWFGTIILYADNSVEVYYSSDEALVSTVAKASAKMAAPLPEPDHGAGGGAYVRFPWQPSKAVRYGLLGIHNAGYSLSAGSGWRAVDLVSGSDMGSGAASDVVYASVTGTVSYVCEDSDSTAIVVSGSGDQFLYAHLIDNANLEIDHAFTAGGVIGTLRHGSFAGDLVGNCGYATQTADHWHLHWGFIMSNGRFQAEGCILTQSISTSVGGAQVGTAGYWTCGPNKIKTNDILTHWGDIPGNDTGAAQVNNQSFFSLLLSGITSIADALFGNTLPEHGTQLNNLLSPILTSIKIVMRISYVLLRGNFNMAAPMAVVGIAIVIRISLIPIGLIAVIWRFIKTIPFVP